MQLDFHRDPGILGPIIDKLAAGIFTVDAQGTIVDWSGGAERITGYRSDEIVGRSFQMLDGPAASESSLLAELMAQASVDSPTIGNRPWTLLGKNGRAVPIHGSARLVYDDQRRVVGVIGTFTDRVVLDRRNGSPVPPGELETGDGRLEGMVGQSDVMREVFRRLRLAAQTDLPLLISGEPGTGRELAARTIHALSRRAARPFLTVLCAAIPDALLESELFGHVQGAFHGAIRDKTGKYQAADGGTLFLDDVESVRPAVRAKLLATLRDHQVHRVGDDRPIPVDVRVIAATCQEPRQLMQTDDAGAPLFDYIGGFSIALPPLRQRSADIPLLIDHFLRESAARQGRPVVGIARDALARLMAYEWPGNVRQLRSAVEHALVTGHGERLTASDLPPEVRAASLPNPLFFNSTDLDDPALVAERKALVDALERAKGNRTAAAKMLGVSRVTLWKRLKKHQVD